jgi:protein tyrosine phosphatase (PTP) superfamily phosphohydrolase (DUF442 family)
LVLFPWTALSANEPRQSQRPASADLEPLPKATAPIVLCIDDKQSVGGQPSDQAYAKAAASGFRSVLTFRARTDGVVLWRERLMVEKNRLRYFNLPVLTALPRLDQLNEFLRLVRDKANHPMLVNCAFIERVAPYMMIFNLVEQGWNEERAVEDASKSGLHREDLQALARSYLKSRGNQAKPKTHR